MEDQANNLVSLPVYLRQQGCLANPQVRAGIMEQIATGKLTAYMKAVPTQTPVGKSFAAIVREALTDATRPAHVLAKSVPQVMSQLEMAAMGVPADWNLLNRLLVAAPVEGTEEHLELQQPQRHVYKREKDLTLILDTLRAEGFEPKALPPREEGKATPKAVVRRILVEKTKLLSSVSKFDRGWEYGREIQEISEVDSVKT